MLTATSWNSNSSWGAWRRFQSVTIDWDHLQSISSQDGMDQSCEKQQIEKKKWMYSVGTGGKLYYSKGCRDPKHFFSRYQEISTILDTQLDTTAKN